MRRFTWKFYLVSWIGLKQKRVGSKSRHYMALNNPREFSLIDLPRPW